MTDEELLTQAPGLPVLYFDGYGAYRKINGVMRCVGYTFGLGAQYNLLCSITGAEMSNRAHRLALDDKVPNGTTIWSGTSVAH